MIKNKIKDNVKHPKISYPVRDNGLISKFERKLKRFNLTDNVGSGTFTRASGQWIEDYQGVLKYVGDDIPGFKGARLSGSTWLTTDHNGNQILERSDYPNNHETSHTYIAGDKVYLSRFGLTCTVGGDSGGTAPTVSDTDIGSTIIDNEVTWAVDGYATLEGIQLEEASTNLLLYNEEFDNVVWTKQANVTITPNQFIAPDGTLTADKYNISAPSLRAVIQSGLSLTNATLSLWVYPIVNTTIRLAEDFPVIAGKWQRLSASSVSGTSIQFYDVSGSIGDRFYIWRAQLEEKPFATSPIKTEGATATRDATLLSYPVAGNLPVNDFSIEMEVTPWATGFDNMYLLGSRIDASNFFGIKLVSNQIVLRKISTAVQPEVAFDYIPLADVPFIVKVILSSLRGMEISVNAGTPETNIDTGDCSLGTTYEVGSYNNTFRFPGYFKNVKIFKYAKPASWLEE